MAGAGVPAGAIAISRAMVSVPPPAAKGTTRLTGLLGHGAARAGIACAAARAARVPRVLRRDRREVGDGMGVPAEEGIIRDGSAVP